MKGKLIYYALVIVFAITPILLSVTACRPETRIPQPATIARVDSVFLKEYTVKRLNEHELQLISIADTVTLYLENTYGFTERIVFIKK
jgi:hypothetical protein